MTTLLHDPESVTLTVLDNALEPRRYERETVQLPRWGQPIAELLPARVTPDGSWVVIENGRVLPPEEWATVCAKPGSEVLCYPTLRDGDTALQIGLGVVLVAAAVVLGPEALIIPGVGFGFIGPAAAIIVGGLGAGLVVGGVASAIIGPPSPPVIPAFGSVGIGSAGGAASGSRAAEAESSPTYGWRGVQNSTRLGAPIPVLYGTHKVGGQYIELYLSNANDESTLYALCALSEGEVSSVALHKINGQPAGNFRGISTDTRVGTNGQSAISLFGDKTTATFNVDAAISTSWLSYTTNGANVTAFEILVEFQGGLFTVESDGALSTASVTLSVEYKLSSAGGWTSLGSFTFTEGKRAVLRRTIRADGLTAGRYDLRISRTTAESGSVTRIDAVRRTAINEIVNDAYVYPNVALGAVKALATDQLSGGTPTITWLVSGVKVKVFSAAGVYTVAWSNNPAWIVFDMLTNRRYGMGQFIWPILYDTGTVSVTNGSPTVTGSGTSFTGKFRKGDKLVIPGQGRVGTVSTVDSATQLTLTANWAGATASGLAYEVHRDDLDIQSFVDWAAFCDASVSDGNGGTHARATCDYIFDADGTRIWDAVVKICGLGLAAPIKLGNYLRIKFQQAESAAQLFTMSNIVKGSFQEVFLPLKERANYFEVQYLNAANDYEQDMVVLEDPLLFTNTEPERKQTVSVFGVTRTAHALRLARFYQLANRYITRTITFETGLEAIVCEPGDVINFQHDVPGWGQASRAAAGSMASTIVLDMPVTIGAGTYQVMVRHADDTIETKTVTDGAGTYTTLHISGTWTSTPADGDVVAVGVQNILVKSFRVIAVERTQDLNCRLTAVEYNAAIFDETNLTPANIVQYSTLNALLGPVPVVTNLKIMELNNVTASVWISFKPPASLNYATTRIYRTVNGVDYLVGENREGAFSLSGVAVGELLTVKAVTVSINGVVGPLSSAPTASAVVTLTSPPNVAGFSWYYLGGHIRLFWEPVNWIHPVEYEIRKGAAWASAIVLGRIPDVTVDGAGNGTYWVAAYDTINRTYSAAPASLSIEIFRMAAGDTLADNVVQTKDEDADKWLGTLSGGAMLDVANNWIFLGGTGLFDDIPDVDAVASLDFYGGVDDEGAYEVPSANIVDLGSVKSAHIVCTYAARGDTTLTTWDAIPDFDAEPDIDGSYSDKVDLQIEINTAQADGVFTGWRKFVPGLHVFRKVKLRAVLKSFDTGVTCILTDFNWTVDMPDRDERQADVALVAGGQSFTFTPAFQAVPALEVTIQDAQTGDYLAMTAKSVNGFTLQVKNAAGSGVARTIDWHARGY